MKTERQIREKLTRIKELQEEDQSVDLLVGGGYNSYNSWEAEGVLRWVLEE